MDISARRDGKFYWLKPESARGRRWFTSSYHSTKVLHVPAEVGAMLIRILREDDFVVAVDLEDEPQRDDRDIYGAYLIARSKRLNGDAQAALVTTIVLREEILRSVDPKCTALLPLVDEELAAAHAISRRRTRDQRHATQKRWPRLGWLGQAATEMEVAILRVAISLMLAVDVYRVTVERLWS